MCAPCFLHIPVFIVRLLAAVWFGITSPTSDPILYAMLTIPIAFILAIAAAFLDNRDTAKGKGGLAFFMIQCLYYVFWGLAIGDHDVNVCLFIDDVNNFSYEIKDKHVKNIACVIFLLLMSMCLDTHINRKFLRKWGAKLFMGSEDHEKLRIIKKSKKQKRWIKKKLNDLPDSSLNKNEQKIIIGLKIQMIGCTMGKPLDKFMWT